jgi:GNAT superfamily N-acetyltransferase
MTLDVLPGTIAIVQLDARAPTPAWAQGAFASVTRTAGELSIVCDETSVPGEARAERGWRVLRVAGPLDFALTGVLASLTAPLAAATVSIFAVSTFDTDYILVRADALDRALEALRGAGHEVTGAPPSAPAPDRPAALPVSIRPACASDERALLDLAWRLADFPLPAWRTAAEVARADDPILLDALRGRLPDAAILVAESAPDGRPVAYVFATTKRDYFTEAPYAHVEALAVRPDFEGRGVARALMNAIEQWARARSYGWVTLNVFDGNTRARALYERLGYELEIRRYRKAL